MSLILEALRKSEAQRRRGQPPDLFAELPPVAPRRDAATPPWLWPALALALLVATLVLARAWWNASAGTGQAVTAEASGLAAVAPPATPPRPAPAVRAGEVAADVPLAAAPAGAAAPTPAVATVRPATSVASATATVQPASIPAPAGDASPAPPGPAAASAPAAPPDPVPAPAPVIPGEPVPPAPVAAVGTVAAPRAGGAPLLSLSDLSADERRQLPPLKMSMHLWSPDPARRFVILDGHRLVEGDRVGAAVVERIADDGVVLAWNRYRLRLPLP